jgi:hypothetical protein
MCASTAYPTPVPTQNPTPAAIFSTGTITAVLPLLYFDMADETGKLKNCTEWSSCAMMSSCNSLAGFTFQNNTNNNDKGQYRDWQHNLAIPADIWFGCQILEEPPDQGLKAAQIPGGPLNPSVDTPFTPETLVKMLSDGCYTIKLEPQSTTTSTVKHWSDADEYTHAASSALSTTTNVQTSAGLSMLGAAMSASFQSTNSKSTAAYRSNSNIGATISRKLHIASIENTCTAKRHRNIGNYLIKSRNQAQKVLTLLSPSSYATRNNATIQGELTELLRFGAILPIAWSYSYYYLYTLSLAYQRASDLSSSQASMAIGAAANVNVSTRRYMIETSSYEDIAGFICTNESKHTNTSCMEQQNWDNLGKLTVAN